MGPSSDSVFVTHDLNPAGPLAELEYWKQRTAKFSYLVDQLKSHPFKGVLITIVTAKSKVLKVNEGGVNSLTLVILLLVPWTQTI